MGRWLYVNLLLLALAACFGAVEIRDYFKQEEPPPTIGTRRIGPWRVTLKGDVAGHERPSTFVLRLDCDACDAPVRAAEIVVPGCPTASSPFRGPPNRRVAAISLPAACGAPAGIDLILTGWDGVVARETWPLPHRASTRPPPAGPGRSAHAHLSSSRPGAHP